MNRLKDKVAIITGAAGGQGKAEAILFAKHGAKIVVTDINEEELNRTATEIEGNGGKVIVLKHDISSEKDWKAIVEKTETTYGKLNILINNAGILQRDGVEKTTLELFNKIQSVNSVGTFLGMKAVTPLMKKSKGGSIINISSIYGLVGSAGSTAYHASKGAIRLMTKSAAVELSKHYIRVNSIHPGVIVTPMTIDSFTEDGDHPLKSKTPWPELGHSNDIAYGALYLASDESRFVTGTELVIDGGYTAQ